MLRPPSFCLQHKQTHTHIKASSHFQPVKRVSGVHKKSKKKIWRGVLGRGTFAFICYCFFCFCCRLFWTCFTVRRGGILVAQRFRNNFFCLLNVYVYCVSVSACVRFVGGVCLCVVCGELRSCLLLPPAHHASPAHALTTAHPPTYTALSCLLSTFLLFVAGRDILGHGHHQHTFSTRLRFGYQPTMLLKEEEGFGFGNTTDPGERELGWDHSTLTQTHMID